MLSQVSYSARCCWELQKRWTEPAGFEAPRPFGPAYRSDVGQRPIHKKLLGVRHMRVSCLGSIVSGDMAYTAEINTGCWEALCMRVLSRFGRSRAVAQKCSLLYAQSPFRALRLLGESEIEGIPPRASLECSSQIPTSLCYQAPSSIEGFTDECHQTWLGRSQEASRNNNFFCMDISRAVLRL